MKKYLYSALALPLLFACSSEDLSEQGAISNDQFAGIEKVDAEFSMEGTTRFDGAGDLDPAWTPQEGDLWGFAWEGDGTVVPVGTGVAKQNHNLIQTNGIFTPQTSIYVGKYFIYRPYDETTVSPQAINFNSLKEQTIAEGFASSTQAWKDLATTAINIGSKWTVVNGAGWVDDNGKRWDKAGIKQNYKLYAAMFSNQTGLDLTYTKNDPAFTEDKVIKGASDIELTLKKGDKVGAAKILRGTIELAGAANAFTYAPTASPEAEAHDAIPAHNGAYWADKKNLGAGEGFNFGISTGAITLNVGNDGISTEGKETAWFWFNSLPVTAGDGAVGTVVTPVFETTYGQVTVKKSYDPETNYTVGDCAYAFEQPNEGAVDGEAKEWIKLNDEADDDLMKAKDKKTWKLSKVAHKTFINQYGNHKGKYSVTVDFSKGVMNNMHIQSDAHLQQALKYYIASGKTENVTLNLDGASDEDKTFKLSKISIALIQSIAGNKVKVQACATHNNPVKIIITQEGSAGKTLVPNLNGVFAAATDVYLAGDGTTWTWSDKIKTGDVVGKLTIDGNVSSITNLGTLDVTTTNIELSVAGKTLTNAKDATMNITKVTTVKNALTNLGTINVGSETPKNFAAELRAYNVNITNDATALNTSGTINNWGVVGVTYETTGHVYNYGTIDMKQPGAITLLTSNELGGAFQSAWADDNKLGTVKLPNGAPNALVSVANGAENGFIEYVWDGGTTYATPNSGTVKYNTIIVSTDIKFTANEPEIQYIKFDGIRTQVTNPTDGSADDQGKLGSLKAIIVNKDKSIIIEKGNGIVTTNSAHLYSGAAIYQGGVFNPKNKVVAGKTVTDYLGTWSTDQVVKY